MVSLRLDSCCLCIKLRSACLIFGFIGAFESGLILCTGIILTVLSSTGILLDPMERVETDSVDSYNLDPLITVMVSLAVSLCVLVLLILLMDFAFNVTLIVGVYKDKLSHIKAWTIYKLISLLAGGICMLALTIYIKKWYFYFMTAISIVMDTYSWIIVTSYYYELSTSKSNSHLVYSC